MTDKPLSPRHQRFVAEYLRDGNATQAYIRAGYSARGAQSCASRLLSQPRIEAALSAGRQRIAQSLQVTVERVAQEYAAIAFAPVDVGLDHGKALQATRLKLQALAALTRHLDLFTEKPEPGLTAEDRERYEATIKEHELQWQHALESRRKLARERDEARIALAAAEAKTPKAESKPLQSIAASAPRDGAPDVSVVSLEQRMRRNLLRSGTLSSAEALRLMEPGGFPAAWTAPPRRGGP